MSDWLHQIAGTAKLATVGPAVIAALLAVLLEFKRHTWGTAALALFSGAFVAYVATDPLVAFLNLDAGASHAVAGVLGISGRNLIVWVLTVSRDPLETWKTFWTKR
jgi:hypothetical protein